MKHGYIICCILISLTEMFLIVKLGFLVPVTWMNTRASLTMTFLIWLQSQFNRILLISFVEWLTRLIVWCISDLSIADVFFFFCTTYISFIISLIISIPKIYIIISSSSPVFFLSIFQPPCFIHYTFFTIFYARALLLIQYSIYFVSIRIFLVHCFCHL